MQTNLSEYPPPSPTRLITPGILTLDRVRWGYNQAIVSGTVGADRFAAIVDTATLLDRRTFVRHLWRYHHILGVLPSIEAWQEMIASAEGGAQ